MDVLIPPSMTADKAHALATSYSACEFYQLAEHWERVGNQLSASADKVNHRHKRLLTRFERNRARWLADIPETLQGGARDEMIKRINAAYRALVERLA